MLISSATSSCEKFSESVEITSLIIFVCLKIIQYHSIFFGNLFEVFSIFFSLLATLRSTFLMSSAVGRFSGFIPRCPSICLTLTLF